MQSGAQNIDLVYSFLKVASLIATVLFSALALLKPYKDSSGRITKWGKVALGGILLSSAISLGLYTLETSRARLAAEAARKAAEIARVEAEATKTSLSDILDKAKTTAERQEANLAKTDKLQTDMGTSLHRQKLNLEGTDRIAKDMRSSIVAQQTLLTDNQHILAGLTSSLTQQVDLLNQTKEISLDVNRSLFPIQEFTLAFQFSIPFTHPVVSKYVSYLDAQVQRLLPQFRASWQNAAPGQNVTHYSSLPIEGLMVQEETPVGGRPNFTIMVRQGSPHVPAFETPEGKLLARQRFSVAFFKPPVDIDAIRKGNFFKGLADVEMDVYSFAYTSADEPRNQMGFLLQAGRLTQEGFNKPLNLRLSGNIKSLLDFGGTLLLITFPGGLDKMFEFDSLSIYQPNGMCFRLKAKSFERIDVERFPLAPIDERADTVFLLKLPDDFRLTAHC